MFGFPKQEALLYKALKIEASVQADSSFNKRLVGTLKQDVFELVVERPAPTSSETNMSILRFLAA